MSARRPFLAGVVRFVEDFAAFVFSLEDPAAVVFFEDDLAAAVDLVVFPAGVSIAFFIDLSRYLSI